jgi:hypothetical protein
MEKLYNLSPEERKSRGLKGREWVQSDESNMSTRKMNENVIEVLDTTMQKFQPRKHFEFIKIKDYPKKKLAHKLIY